MKTKLVRDKVIDQAKTRGRPFLATRKLDHYEYIAALANKLVEEAGEFERSLSIEELADVDETLRTLARELTTLKHLRKVRKTKKDIRGGFEGRILATYDDHD